jgi:hypothetical protein
LCINKVLGPKAWIEYFSAFLDSCYQNDKLTSSLLECTNKALSSLKSKHNDDYIKYETCIKGYDKEKKSVETNTQLGALLLENHNFKERFLPFAPSLRINEQMISVKTY